MLPEGFVAPVGLVFEDIVASVLSREHRGG